MPHIETPKPNGNSYEAVSDLLRVYLKAVIDREKVAGKLIATSSELDAIARGDQNVPALKGWRKKIFGDDAIRIRNGEVGISVKNGKIELMEL